MTKKDAIKLLELPDAEMYSVVEIRKAYRKAMQKNIRIMAEVLKWLKI